VKKVCGILGVIILFVACAGQSQQEKGTKSGALIGAGAGAVIGQLIGKDTKGTVIGAAAGTALGALVGNRVGAYMDKQEEELRKAAEASEAMSIKRAEDAIVATFKADVLFDVGSANLKPGAYSEMDRVAGVLGKYPDTRIRVEGHTDASGSDAHNQGLSERRAAAVKTALVQRSVAPERIQTIGYGETMPISPEPAQNRRVSLVITPTAQG